MSFSMPANLANERKVNSGIYCPPNRNYPNARDYQVSFMENQASDPESDRRKVAKPSMEAGGARPQENGHDTAHQSADAAGVLLGVGVGRWEWWKRFKPRRR